MSSSFSNRRFATRRARLGLCAALVTTVLALARCSNTSEGATDLPDGSTAVRPIWGDNPMGLEHRCRPRSRCLRPIGIVNPMGLEQAPILSAMHVERSQVIDGYTFWIGTLDGQPVVNVGSGEIDPTMELATYILIKNFNPRMTILSGTAGSQNPDINVGDVVVSGYVVNKSSIHYQSGGRQEPYQGVQIPLTDKSKIDGAIINGYGAAYPNPENAANYGSGPLANDTQLPFVSALVSPRQLTDLAGKCECLGTTSAAIATGDSSATGSINNMVWKGVIGDADTWTEPMDWLESQNALYQTDVEENEGMAFAFINAKLGVPWLIVRGISDTPWYPNAKAMVIAASQAASVARYVVSHAPQTTDTTPNTLFDLSKKSNASKFGYVVGTEADYRVTPVTKVVPGSTDNPVDKPKAWLRSQLKTFRREFKRSSGTLAD